MAKTQNTRRNRRTPRFDAEAYVAEQRKAVHSAGELAGELAGIARGRYAEKHGAECPADRIPSPDFLRNPRFLRTVEADTWTAYGENLARIAGRWKDETPKDKLRADFVQRIAATETPDLEASLESVLALQPQAPDTFAKQCGQSTEAGYAPALEMDAQAWRAQPRKQRGKHPAAPIVAAWLHGAGIEPDRRDSGIMPAAMKKAAAIVTDPFGEAIGFGDTGYTPQDGTLPLFDDYPDTVRVPYALQVFDFSGGESLQAGRGAPLAIRLHTEILFALPYASRNGGRTVVNCTLQDLITWVYGEAESFRMSRHFPRIARALHEVHNLRLAWPGGFWNVVSVRNLPNRERDSRIRLDVELPPGVVSGAQVHRPTLRAYGLDNVAAYRAWLGVCEYWDAYGTHNGRLIHATRPQVQRNEAGHLTNPKGEIITGRGGVPVRSNWSKQAIRTGKQEPNPAREAYRYLTPDQLALLVFGEAPKGTKAVTLRQRRRRALATLKAMEADGNLSLEYDGAGGVRILPPAWFRRHDA